MSSLKLLVTSHPYDIHFGDSLVHLHSHIQSGIARTLVCGSQELAACLIIYPVLITCSLHLGRWSCCKLHSSIIRLEYSMCYGAQASFVPELRRAWAG